MKINCPHCQCAYDLEPIKMPSPKYNEMQESWGWKFECGACDYQWWLKLVNTELALTKRTGTHDNYIDDHFFDNNYQRSRFKVSDNKDEPLEEIKNLPIVVPKRNAEKSKRLSAPPLPRQNLNGLMNSRQADVSSTSFWVSILVLLAIFLGITYVYRDIFQQKWHSLMLNHPMKVSAMSLPLAIQQVHWDKVDMPDGGVKVAVIGEVLNQNQAISGLRALHLSAWGPCNSGEKESAKCLVGGSIYTFKKPTILPEERLSFQTTWILPKGSIVSGIDVTLP
ncbi:MAG: hypothetical protein V4482_06925 [Pseudomonadota bacterium]